MKLNYSIRIFVFVVISFLISNFKVSAFEQNRKVTRAFAIDKGTEVQVTNKYGNIHLVNWEKDSILFEVNIFVNSIKQEKVEKTHSEIDIGFTLMSRYIIAATKFKNEQGSFIDEVNTLATTLFNSSNRVQIDYKVYLPATCPVRITNKFGNVYMTDAVEDVYIDLSNGDLKANEFKKNLDLKIDFGNIDISQASDVKIVASYARIDLSIARKLHLESKSSTIDLKIINELEVNSRRDKININEVQLIRGETSFSDIRIDQFSGDANLVANYGEIDIAAISPTFGKMNISAKYTDISLNFSRDANLNLSLEYTKQTVLSSTIDLSGIKKETIDEKNGLYKSAGIIGSGKTFPEVRINVVSGRITLSNI